MLMLQILCISEKPECECYSDLLIAENDYSVRTTLKYNATRSKTQWNFFSGAAFLNISESCEKLSSNLEKM